MDPRTDRLLHWMPIIVRSEGISDWERKFCASVIARSRSGKGPWEPSERQLGVMRRLVDRFVREALSEPVCGDDAQ